MADNNGASKYAVYWYRSLCLETEKANVVLVRKYSKISTILGVMNMKAGGILLIAGCIIGVPLLPIVYGKIYRNYKR